MTTNQRRPISICLPAVACLFAWLTPATLRADLIELINGDHYSGVVISLNKTNLEFQSEIQGLVKIPREKVAQITLREATPKPGVKLPATSSGTQAQPDTNTTATATAAAPPNQTSSVIQQMRQQGVDPGMMNKIQEQMLGQSSPEATRMFNEMVAGLMGGSLNVEDVRAQARKAINDIQSAKKDLGNDAGTAEVLDGYLGILQKFVSETDAPSPASSPKPSAATPAK
jgi:hypothetical protein